MKYVYIVLLYFYQIGATLRCTMHVKLLFQLIYLLTLLQSFFLELELLKICFVHDCDVFHLCIIMIKKYAESL